MITKINLSKKWHNIVSVIIILVSCIVLFSIDKTTSGYKSFSNISMESAIPVLSIETNGKDKALQFADYGWATHGFDIVNGKLTSDGVFQLNEIDMEYYINAVQDSGTLPLNLKALYYVKDDWSLDNETGPLPYVEGKGFGPFDLGYKVDDQTVINADNGYQESKYVLRKHYLLVYTYGTCALGDSGCASGINIDEAGKDYKFHLEVKAYQKIN